MFLQSDLRQIQMWRCFCHSGYKCVSNGLSTGQSAHRELPQLRVPQSRGVQRQGELSARSHSSTSCTSYLDVEELRRPFMFGHVHVKRRLEKECAYCRNDINKGIVSDLKHCDSVSTSNVDCSVLIRDTQTPLLPSHQHTHTKAFQLTSPLCFQLPLATGCSGLDHDHPLYGWLLVSAWMRL